MAEHVEGRPLNAHRARDGDAIQRPEELHACCCLSLIISQSGVTMPAILPRRVHCHNVTDIVR